MELPTGRVTIPDGVVRRGFGEEIVVLNLGTSQYHGLNATGGRMLDLLEETGDAAEAARRIADEFAIPIATAEADVGDLCEQLLERGLIKIAG